MPMKLPITYFGPPKKEKEVERYFIIRANYKSTKKKNYGDGMCSEVRFQLNEHISYGNWNIREVLDSKIANKLKDLFSYKKGKAKATKLC